MKDLRAILRENRIGRSLTSEELDAMAACARIEDFQPGDVVFREGDPADAVAVLVRGEVEVYKTTPDGRTHRLAMLHAGRFFGVSAFRPGLARTADVKARLPSSILWIRLGDGQQRGADWVASLAFELVGELASRVDRSSETAIEAAHRALAEEHRRVVSGRFLVVFTAALALYTILLGVSLSATKDPFWNDVVPNAAMMVFAVGVVGFIRTSPYPASFFGVTLRATWPRELAEAVAWSLGIIVAATLVKGLVVALVPAYAAEPVLVLRAEHEPFTARGAFSWALYLAICPVQELCARGALQGSLQELLDGQRGATVQAILLSNVMFAATHAHVSPLLSLLTFVPGLFWGVLYHRQGSLLGVSLSHMIVGAYALELLGGARLVRMLP